MKKIAEEQLAIIEAENKNIRPIVWVGISKAKLARICKALLKCLK